MNAQTLDIVLVAAAVSITSIWFIISSTIKRFKPTSNVAFLSVAFSVAGLLMGQKGIAGYVLMGAGILLTLTDITIRILDNWPSKKEN